MLPGGLGLTFPKFCYPVLDPLKVTVSSGELKFVEQRNAALFRDNVSGEGEMFSKVAVARGNHALQERTRGRIIQKPDHLFWDRSSATAVRKGRQDQNKGRLHRREPFRLVARNTERRMSKSLNEPVCVF